MHVFVVTVGTASSLSTGGAGVYFEQHVGAMFLALLLTRGIPAIFLDCQVKEVSFQTRRLDRKTDDLLVTCSSRNETRKLAMQVKRSFAIGKSRGKETIQRFWNDFNSGTFRPDRDSLILVTLNRTENLGGLASLLECARSSPDQADFKSRLETPRFVSDAARNCYENIRSVVDNAGSSGSADEERLWRFLKTVYVLFYDFTTDTAQQEATVKQWLAMSSRDPDAAYTASAAWDKLVGIASNASIRAKTLRRSDLPDDMLERYDPIPAPVLQPLTDHSATVLNGIRSSILDATTLPRAELTAEAAMALGDRVVALTGAPGFGKSALAKAIIKQHSANHLCLSFRATEFAKSHIDDVLPGRISGERFRTFVGAQERVLIHVDGLERLLECSTRNAFDDLVDIAELCPNVSLVLTCRDAEIDTAAAALFGRSPLTCHMVEVPPLSAGEVGRVRGEIPGLAHPLSRPELARIMNSPYVLDMAARMDWSDGKSLPSDAKAFWKKWWSEVVRKDGRAAGGLPERRERTLIDIAVRRARELSPSIPTDKMDAEALDKLRKDGIIVAEDGGLAATAHDVIEDRAVIRWFEYRAARHRWAARSMAEDVGTHPAVRRGFREWLKEGLDANAEKADRFVLSAYGDASLPMHFRDDVLVSLLTSNSARKFIARQKDHILDDEASLLVRMMHLTRVACTKEIESDDGGPVPKPLLMEPDGEAWPALLEVIDDSFESILPGCYEEVLGMLECWAGRPQSPEMPEGAASAIRTSYRLLYTPYARGGDTRRILRIIAGVPRADRGSFLRLLELASSESERQDVVLGEFRDVLMGELGFPACRDFPNEMAEFVRSLCIPVKPDADRIWKYFERFSPEFKFGLYPHASSDFIHFSAFRGPFWPLLVFHPEVGIRLVLDLVNHAGDWYGTNGADAVPHIAVSVPGHPEVVQEADDILWQAYRGTSEVPHVIACALMALEHWLLKMCALGHGVESLLLTILLESRNVMTTGVVAGVCSAHPNLCGTVPAALLKSERCVDLDRSRAKKEGRIRPGRHAAVSREDRRHDDELRKSSALPHRRRDLKSLASELQPGVRKGRSPDGQGGGRVADYGAAKINPVQPDRSIPEAEDSRAGASASLYAWGLERWNRDSNGSSEWRRALALARNGAEPRVESGLAYLAKNGPPVVAAVCVRDHWEEMSADERRWCVDEIASEVGRCSDNTNHSASVPTFFTDSDSIAARSLPKMLAADPDNEKILEAVAVSLTHASRAVRFNSAIGAGEYLEPKRRDLLLRCAGVLAMFPNLSAGKGRRRPQEGRESIPGRFGSERDAPELARRAFVDGSVNAEAELEELDFAARCSRDAALHIMHALGRAPDLPAAKRFVAKAGRAVVDTWTDEYETIGCRGQMFAFNAVRGLAEIILSLPRAPLQYCRPFLDAVDARPDRVASFIRSLAMQMGAPSAALPFWDAWQAFADKTIEASWTPDVVFEDSKGAELIRCMVLDMGWPKDSQRWARLPGHEERVVEFAGLLPPTPHVLESFARYLYGSGAGTDPAALKAVAGHLRAGGLALLGSKETIYCLAGVLQRYVYGRPAMLKEDPVLLDDTLLMLDMLVDAGSPAAYKMRDYFVTPNVGKG